MAAELTVDSGQWTEKCGEGPSLTFLVRWPGRSMLSTGRNSCEFHYEFRCGWRFVSWK
jgi:hypothetical protein